MWFVSAINGNIYSIATFYFTLLIRVLSNINIIINWNYSNEQIFCDYHVVIRIESNCSKNHFFFFKLKKNIHRFSYNSPINRKIDLSNGTPRNNSASLTDLVYNGLFVYRRLTLMASYDSLNLKKLPLIAALCVFWSPKNSTHIILSFIPVTKAGHSQKPRILHRTTSPISTLQHGANLTIGRALTIAVDFFVIFGCFSLWSRGGLGRNARPIFFQEN